MSESKMIMTKPNIKEKTALDAISKPNNFATVLKISGKMLTINIIKAENSQSRVYFKESMFFLKK
ncbi:MAG: hypothetical protein FWH05_07285 [Oscillospiraceae bacterium]|nr:hypothetical protein [Oscillospiraceae bacterium]